MQKRRILQLTLRDAGFCSDSCSRLRSLTWEGKRSYQGAQTLSPNICSVVETGRRSYLSQKVSQIRWTRPLKVKSTWNCVCISWSQENMSWSKTGIFSSVYRPAIGNQSWWKELKSLNLRGSPPLKEVILLCLLSFPNAPERNKTLPHSSAILKECWDELPHTRKAKWDEGLGRALAENKTPKSDVNVVISSCGTSIRLSVEESCWLCGVLGHKSANPSPLFREYKSLIKDLKCWIKRSVKIIFFSGTCKFKKDIVISGKFPLAFPLYLSITCGGEQSWKAL